METDTIIVKHQFDKAAFSRMWADMARRGTLALVGVAALIAGGVAILPASNPEEQREDFWLAVIAGAFFVLLAVLRKPVFRRAFVKSRIHGLPMKWKITPRRLYCEAGEGLEAWRCDFSWAMVKRVRRRGNGFLLEVSTLRVQWLPYDGFESPAKVEEFHALAGKIAEQKSKIANC